MAPRLKEQYQSEIKQQLQADLELDNVMQIPTVSKIVVNMGAGDAAADSKLINGVVADLRLITGQQPKVNRARKSVSNFKLREGQAVGASVTIRGDRMWEFLDRLMNVALPRVRDFRGVSPKAFDGRGNYTLGVKDHMVFPDVDYDKVDSPKGLNVTIVTTAANDEQAFYLLRELGMPFVRPRDEEG